MLLTGAFEPVDRDRARKLGVDGVLAKPFEPQVAIGLVRQLLEQPPLSPPRTVTAVVAAVAGASPSDWAVDVSTRGGSTGAGSGGTDAATGSAGYAPAGRRLKASRPWRRAIRSSPERRQPRGRHPRSWTTISSGSTRRWPARV